MVKQRFLRLPEVCRIVGLPRSTIYKLMVNGDFPKPIPLTERTRAWLEDEIILWQEERVLRRPGHAA
jgi:prophage regulatory protein